MVIVTFVSVVCFSTITKSDHPDNCDSKGQRLGFCLCMVYCSRGSLKQVLDRARTGEPPETTTAAVVTGTPEKGAFSPLPWDLRCKLATGTAQGMEALYARTTGQVQHRDLKVSEGRHCVSG
jgi:serine/threonine protein kinase